ncbi:MAG: hypothetical protein IT362_10445 [Deltaproteobacteria bacterium]|nr:hypothetical protein [Deltaproteobacteria bacterium]
MTENFDGTEKTFLFASLDPKLKATGLRLAYPFNTYRQRWQAAGGKNMAQTKKNAKKAGQRARLQYARDQMAPFLKALSHLDRAKDEVRDD